MEGRRAFACVLALAGVLGACSSTPPPTQPPAHATPKDSAATVPAANVDANECRRRIEHVDLDEPTTLDDVEACLYRIAGEQAAREVLASGPTGGPAWAAVWVYASAGSDPAPLRPLLTAADASVRTMAAATIVAFGDGSGFAILREALTDERRLAGSHPAISIADFALSSLMRYVVGDTTPAQPETDTDVATVRADWAQWMNGNAASLTFDDAAGTWSPR